MDNVAFVCRNAPLFMLSYMSFVHKFTNTF